jgi:hypothetical protein
MSSPWLGSTVLLHSMWPSMFNVLSLT